MLRPEILLIDRPGEACAVSEAKGWDKVRVQVGSGAIGTVGPKEIAKALKMKANAKSNKDLGYVAANGSKIKNYGERRIVGHAESGDRVSVKTQRADI